MWRRATWLLDALATNRQSSKSLKLQRAKAPSPPRLSRNTFQPCLPGTFRPRCGGTPPESRAAGEPLGNQPAEQTSRSQKPAPPGTSPPTSEPPWNQKPAGEPATEARQPATNARQPTRQPDSRRKRLSPALPIRPSATTRAACRLPAGSHQSRRLMCRTLPVSWCRW